MTSKTTEADEGTPTVCTKHPQHETSLRCNRCDRYICHECAVHTPVGYRCRECVAAHDRLFFDASAIDALRIAVVCALYAAGGALAISIIRFLLLSLLLAFALGPLAGESARRAIGRRRSKQAALAAGGGSLAGALVVGALFGELSLSLLLFAALFAFLASGRLRWRR